MAPRDTNRHMRSDQSLNQLQDWRFTEGTQFRARVVRQAILLGFEAEQYEVEPSRWRFVFKGITRMSYNSEYSAALEYLRLIDFPREKVGRVRGS